MHKYVQSLPKEIRTNNDDSAISNKNLTTNPLTKLQQCCKTYGRCVIWQHENNNNNTQTQTQQRPNASEDHKYSSENKNEKVHKQNIIPSTSLGFRK